MRKVLYAALSNSNTPPHFFSFFSGSLGPGGSRGGRLTVSQLNLARLEEGPRSLAATFGHFWPIGKPRPSFSAI